MKNLLLALIGAGLLLAGLAYWINPSPASRGEIAFTLAEVERGSLTETVSATGQLSPHSVALVSSPMGGQVVKIYRNADFNHHVVEGEPLLLLDQSLPRLQVQEAEDGLAAAKGDLDRATAAREAAQEAVNFKESLLKGPEAVGLKSALMEAKYQLKSAEAALDAATAKVKVLETKVAEAKLGLERTEIRAPISGVIVDKKVALGQIVGPQLPSPLFTIASDLERMLVNVQVAEGDLSKVHDGLDVTFTVYAYTDSNATFEGKVKEIRYLPTNVQGAVFYTTIVDVVNRRASSQANWRYAGDLLALGGAGTLELLPVLQLPPEQPWMLRPGMTANVDMVVRSHRDAWKVPSAAVNFQLDKNYTPTAAEAKLGEWQKRKDRDDWKHVWILDGLRKPWPVFVRVGGVNRAGETGIKDGLFTEVLEWDPDLNPPPSPGDPRSYPRVIVGAPPASKPGIFERPARIIN